MIVQFSELERLRGEVTMVDGGFDPIHDGHVGYFGAAALLGLPVLCNASPDSWIEKKHPPLLAQSQRVTVLDAFRDLTFVHMSDRPTVEVLAWLRPRYYAKGDDWEGRLPELESETCARHDIEIVYLDTVTNSSSALLSSYLDGRGEDGG